MNEKELKRLSRADLLVMLIDSRKEVEDLKGQLEETENELQEYKVRNEKKILDAEARIEEEKAQMAAELTEKLRAAEETFQMEKERMQAEFEERYQHAEARFQEDKTHLETRFQEEKDHMEKTLKVQLEEADKKLQQREIVLEKAGSVAEASLLLNGVFDSVQKAADQYLENIRAREEQSKIDCEAALNANREKAARMLIDTQKECEDMVAQAKEKSEKYWDDVNAQLKELMDTHGYLQSLFKLFDLSKPNRD